MTHFLVTPDLVTHAADATHDAADDLTRELRAMRRHVEDLLGGDWRGAAAASFDRAWLEWHDGARTVVAALEELAEALRASGREYGWRDEGNRAHLQRAALNL